jgi:hypothetical protein
MIPSDPVMLLSYVNTQLRDFYPSLTEFCEEQQISEEEIKEKLLDIAYTYDEALNKFI